MAEVGQLRVADELVEAPPAAATGRRVVGFDRNLEAWIGRHRRAIGDLSVAGRGDDEEPRELDPGRLEVLLQQSGVAADDHAGFLGLANGALLTQVFHLGQDNVAESEQTPDPGVFLLCIVGPLAGVREGGQMDGFFAVAGQVLPHLLRGKGEHRGEQGGENLGDAEDHGLGCASGGVLGEVAIQPVLVDVEVEAGEVHGAEVDDPV